VVSGEWMKMLFLTGDIRGWSVVCNAQLPTCNIQLSTGTPQTLQNERVS